MKTIKLLLIAEFAGCKDRATAEARLDAFRESVLPGTEFGITLFQATADDLSTFRVDPHGGRFAYPRCEES
jgi:hypothetical protein